MAIKFKKLKAQIRKYDKDDIHGYTFVATREQEERYLDTVVCEGSKHRLVDFLEYIINNDEFWRREFEL